MQICVVSYQEQSGLSLLTLVIYAGDDINICHFHVNNMELAEIDLSISLY